ncbi:unnamed protein product [Echinostoma caproni]|uniref:Uncharacterized protein n=1 Tax=Echinostoma caproni TaxID=27848 RepID=A0A183AGF2_9TREM|nr:unnamed protein product [Echinostoma caproni]
MAAAHEQGDAIHLLTSVYGADTGVRDGSGRLPVECLPGTKNGQLLKNVYLLADHRSFPGDAGSDELGPTSPFSSLRNLSDVGLGDPEQGHPNRPGNTQFPWKNIEPGREPSPSRRPRDTSLPRTGRLPPRGPENRSRETSQERQTRKRKRTIEQVAGLGLRGIRPPVDPSTYQITRRRLTSRSSNPVAENELANSIYASVRRRRELTGPIYNPLNPTQRSKSPGSSARVVGRRRGMLSVYDGVGPKPRSPDQNADENSGPSNPVSPNL